MKEITNYGWQAFLGWCSENSLNKHRRKNLDNYAHDLVLFEDGFLEKYYGIKDIRTLINRFLNEQAKVGERNTIDSVDRLPYEIFLRNMISQGYEIDLIAYYMYGHKMRHILERIFYNLTQAGMREFVKYTYEVKLNAFNEVLNHMNAGGYSTDSDYPRFFGGYIDIKKYRSKLTYFSAVITYFILEYALSDQFIARAGETNNADDRVDITAVFYTLSEFITDNQNKKLTYNSVVSAKSIFAYYIKSPEDNDVLEPVFGYMVEPGKYQTVNFNQWMCGERPWKEKCSDESYFMQYLECMVSKKDLDDIIDDNDKFWGDLLYPYSEEGIYKDLTKKRGIYWKDLDCSSGQYFNIKYTGILKSMDEIDKGQIPGVGIDDLPCLFFWKYKRENGVVISLKDLTASQVCRVIRAMGQSARNGADFEDIIRRANEERCAILPYNNNGVCININPTTINVNGGEKMGTLEELGKAGGIHIDNSIGKSINSNNTLINSLIGDNNHQQNSYAFSELSNEIRELKTRLDELEIAQIDIDRVKEILDQMEEAAEKNDESLLKKLGAQLSSGLDFMKENGAKIMAAIGTYAPAIQDLLSNIKLPL